MDHLAGKLQQESEKPKSDIGIKLIPRGTSIPFLSIADDTLILVKANNNAITKVSEILDDFFRKITPNINFLKSSMQVLRNISNHDVLVVDNRLNIQ